MYSEIITYYITTYRVKQRCNTPYPFSAIKAVTTVTTLTTQDNYLHNNNLQYMKVIQSNK